MLGTILIVVLILALLVPCRGGRTVGSGDMCRPAAWDSFSSSWSFSCFLDRFRNVCPNPLRWFEINGRF